MYPKTLIVFIGIAFAGLASLLVGVKVPDPIGTTMVILGSLIMVMGVIASFGLFIINIYLQPRFEDRVHHEKGKYKLTKKVVGICMIGCGMAFVVAGISFFFFTEKKPDGPGVVIAPIGLCALFFYAGWQMITGKV